MRFSFAPPSLAKRWPVFSGIGLPLLYQLGKGFQMAWIESHTHTVRHRKVANLARELRCRRSHAMGHLHSLWHVALEQQEDGDLSSWSDEFIAESADYSGDAPKFVRLLQQHGSLDDRKIHDWLDYAGAFLISKYGGGGNSRGKTRLAAIWSRHGREYGCDHKANDKRVVSDQKATPPNQPNQPNHSSRRSAASKMEETVLNELTRNESGRRSGTDGDAKRLVPDDDTGTGDRGGKGTRST